MKLNTKAVRELMESGCSYDEAVRLVEEGTRIKRLSIEEAKRKAKDESKHNRP